MLVFYVLLVCVRAGVTGGVAIPDPGQPTWSKPPTYCEAAVELLSRGWHGWRKTGPTMMSLQADVYGGLTGIFYRSSVWYPLSGRFTCGVATYPTVAFAVGWQKNDHQSSGFSTAWTGYLINRSKLITWRQSCNPGRADGLDEDFDIGVDIFEAD